MKKTDAQEILEAIQGIDQKLSGKIDGIDQKIDGVEQSLGKKIEGVEYRLSDQIDLLARDVHDIHDDVGELHEAMNVFSSETDRRFTRIESRMVTKDYLDIKLADQQIKVVDHVKERVSCWKEKSILKTAN